VVASGDWTGVSEAAIVSAVSRFEGAIAQAPPVFSALKHEGVPLYTLARRGQPVQKPPRQVHVHRIRVLSVALPEVHFEVCCSAGTYVRTLAADIGRELGCGAHLSELTRTESSGFSLAQALTLEEVEDLARRGAVHARLIPMAQALAGWPEIAADRRLLENVRTGRRLTRRELPAPRDEGPAGDGLLKVLDEQGELAAVLLFKAGEQDLEYACVFARPEG
jgi:tRNA pseudouridine55 synthase